MKILVLCLFLTSFASAPTTCAQILTGLDPSFGNGNGYVITEVGMGDMVVLSDGRIIACGTNLIKFNADGSLDNSFGSGGIAILGGSGTAQQIAIQEDGKIILCREYVSNGFEDPEKYLTRYHPDGTIDLSFGHNGYSDSVSFNGDPTKGFLLQEDGKSLLVDGDYISSTLKVSRLTSEGFIDSSFGTNGTVLHNLNMHHVYCYDAALQTDGKILALGNYTAPDLEIKSFLVRLLPDGALDTSFNHTGIATASGIEFPKAMAVQTDGKIVVLGNNLFEDPAPFYLTRFNTDGSLDWDFGDNGIGRIPWTSGEMNRPSSLDVRNDGKIIVSGWVWYEEESTYKWGLARLLNNGQTDSTFNQDGMLLTSFRSGYSICRKVTVLPNHKIIAIGGSVNEDHPGTGTGVIARYYPDGYTSINAVNNMQNSIVIYPNPASSKIWIENTSGYAIAQISIWDIGGRQLKIVPAQESIAIADLPSGLYYLSVRMDSGITLSFPITIHL